MLCEKCNKNEATFFYHENVNGNEKTYNLCSACKKALETSGEISGLHSHSGEFDSVWGDFASPWGSMDKLLAGFFGDSGLTGKTFGHEDRKCACGMTLREISSGGKVGCPECYEVFGRELEPYIRRVHGKTVHEGRVPGKFREKLDIRRKIEALEKEQSEAIKSENYERAAEIRDMLKDMRAADGGV